MPQPKKGHALGSSPSHQRLMLRNLAASLFTHERIRTTEAKAKLLRPYAERLITKAKKGSVHHRRQVLALIEDRVVVHKLFSEIGPRFSERNGGYTRVLKLGQRNGDGAHMALIELVEAGSVVTVTGEEDSGRRRRLRRPSRRGQEGAAAAPASAATAADDEPGTEVLDGGDKAMPVAAAEEVVVEPEESAEASDEDADKS